MHNDDGNLNDSRDPSTPQAALDAARAQIAAARKRRDELVASGQLPSTFARDRALPNLALPGYTLLRELHRGGQGIVFLAVQHSTSREVAVKILRRNPLAGPADLARYQREVDVLGRLKHPNVVTIYDCGGSGDDVFIVMDYVAGLPLDAHVAEQRSTVRELLALFAKVCDGVNAAHLRGVIHRDLKPSNIRVDDAGEPRVLDFGLAKLTTDPDVCTSAAMTQTGQFIGSLPWASPEQAEGRADLLDLRTDVYSLGIILYQLLTGRFPYPVADRMDAVVRHIAQTSPARPSTLAREVDADVETILLKCLSKEPVRRYQSAGELARDIRNYLVGEPIEAKRDSFSYVLRKQLRRHWVTVTIVASFILLTGAAFFTSLTFWYRAERALVDKEKQRMLAAQRARQTQQIADFQSTMLARISAEAVGRGIREALRSQVQASLERQYIGEFPNRRKRMPHEVSAALAAFDEQAGAASMVDVARKVLDMYILAPAVEAAGKQFADQPLVQAQIRQSLGRSYSAMGLNDAAEPLIDSALQAESDAVEPDEASIAEALFERAAVDYEQGEYLAAARLNAEALSKYCRLFGGDSAIVARTLGALADALLAAGEHNAAEAPAREAVAILRSTAAAEPASFATILNTLARVLMAQSKVLEAKPLFRESYDILRAHGAESASTLAEMQNYAQFLSTQGEFAAAEEVLREALQMDQRVLGYEHPLVATHLNTLAYALHHHGDYDGAEPLYREALALRRRILGDDHPDVGRSLNNVAVLLADKGDYAAAEPIQREALEQRRRVLGDNHPDVARTLNNLAMLLQKKGDYAAAEPVAREALTLRRKALGDEHKDVAFGMVNLAGVLANLEQYDEADALVQQALAIQHRSLGDENAYVAHSLHTLAGIAERRGDKRAAVAKYRDALAMRRKTLGDQHAETAVTMYALGVALHAEEENVEAEALVREAVAVFEKAFPHGHALLASSKDLLAAVLTDTGRPVEAEHYACQAVDLNRRLHPGDHDATAMALSTLAQCQRDQEHLDEANEAITEAADMIQRLHPPDHKLCAPILVRRDEFLSMRQP